MSLTTSSNNTPRSDESVASTSTNSVKGSWTFAQKKHELQNLNNRLAAYIDRVMYLETENSKLNRELRSREENSTREVSNVKAVFESELDVLRNALDREAVEKIRLGLENRRKNLEIVELKTKFEESTKELKEATPYIAQFNALNPKYDQLLIDIKNLKDANMKLIKELVPAKKNFIDVQNIVEKEILQRVTAENKLQSLKERFRLKELVHRQQINDAKTNCRSEKISEVDGNLAKEYKDKLQTELQLIRYQAEEDVKQNKKVISDIFDSKFQHLESELQRKKKAVEVMKDDLNAANTRIIELTSQINDLMVSNNDYLRKITDLDILKENQRAKSLTEIQGLNEQLIAAQDAMAQKVQEYQDLMEIKVGLDMEISDYRKLLESEEERLNNAPKTSDASSSKGIKRKFFNRDATNYGFSKVVTASATGDIEICEVCPDGKFVKLYNKGPKEFALGGYELVRAVAGENVCSVYTFHRSVTLGAGNWLTVVSSTARNIMYEPSAKTSVLNTQAWVVGKLMVTMLLNDEGQEVATHELKRGQVTQSPANVE